MQSGGSFIGALFGTGVLLIAYHYFGWTNVLMLLALFVVAAVTPLMISKRELPIKNIEKKRVSLKDIFLFFNQKNKHKLILVLVFYYAGIIGTLTMLKPYLVDLGYNVKEIAFMSGIFGTAVAAAAALSGGIIMKKLGRKRTLFLFLSLSIMAALYWLFLSLHPVSTAGLYTGIALIWSAYGFSTVAIYTIAMDAVRPGREGTDFTIQIVLTHLSSLLISVLSGKLAHTFNYS
jgi:predicted MFS family arabinose efflux permease